LYKLDPRDFKLDVGLLKKLNIDSIDTLEDTEYILVNEDGLKLPFSSNEVDSAIAFKFILNPTKIHTTEDLFDFLHLSKDLPVKYIFTTVPIEKNKPMLSLQSKLVRKYFYENSQPVEDLIMFGEVTKPFVAKALNFGLESFDQILVVQNQNPYSSLAGKE